MKRAKRLYILLGVLAVLSVAAIAVIQREEHKEKIKDSGEKPSFRFPMRVSRPFRGKMSRKAFRSIRERTESGPMTRMKNFL